MKRPLLHIPAFVIAVLALAGVAVASCSGEHKYNRTLLNADSIMEENPDSALALLKAVRTADLRNAADSALYGLLLTQASVKTDAEFPPDTLIGRALAFYRDADDSDRLMRSLFYDAYVRKYKTTQDALLNALEAYDMASSTGDPYWIAKCAELLGDLQDKTYNDSEAVDFYSEASEKYAECGRKLNSLLSAIDAQRCRLQCIRSGDTAEIRKLIVSLDSISGLAKGAPYEEIVRAHWGRVGSFAALRAHDGLLAKRILAEMDSAGSWNILTDPEERARLHLHLALECNDIQEMERITEAFRKDSVSNATSIVAGLAHVRLLREKGRHKEAADTLYTLFTSVDSQTRGLITNPLVNVHRDYLLRLTEEKERSNAMLRWIIAAVAVISLLVIAVLILANRYNAKSRQLQLKQKTELLENVIRSLRTLESRNESLNQENSAMQMKMQEYAESLHEAQVSKIKGVELEESLKETVSLLGRYRKRISELESDLISKNADSESYREISRSIIQEGLKGFQLIRHLAATPGFPASSAMLKEIDGLIEWLRIDSIYGIIEELINESHGDVMARLRRQCPFLTDKDMRFICLIYAGLSMKHISMIMKLSGNYGYNKKKRICEAIAGSDAPDRIEFTELLQTKKNGG